MEAKLGIPISVADHWEIVEGHVTRLGRGAEAERDGGAPEAQRLPDFFPERDRFYVER
jgi:hypothetical protein